MDESNELGTGNADSIQDSLSNKSHASSTPYHGTAKPDIALMFQKMGQKLGWFEYGDIITAIQTLSKSAKKKSTKSRRNHDSKSSDHSTRVKTDSRNAGKERQQSDISAGMKFHEKQKLSFSSEEPLSEKSPNVPQDLNSDHSTKPIPVRKSKACTDLTKEPRVNKLSLSSRKKLKQKPIQPPDLSEKENSSPEIEPVFHRTKKKTVRISVIPHEMEDFALISHQGSLSSKSGLRGKERLSVGEVLIDDPISESTRIHSRESMAHYIPHNRCPEDAVDVGDPLKESTRIHSRESMAHYLPHDRCPEDALDVGDPLKESTRIHSRESMAHYLPHDRCPEQAVDVGDPLKESTRIHSRESIARYLPSNCHQGKLFGDPVQESTRLYHQEHKKSANHKSDSLSAFPEDISAIKDSESSISLSFNMSSYTGHDEDSYKSLRIQNTLTMQYDMDGSHDKFGFGNLNASKGTERGKKNSSITSVDQTAAYTTAVCGLENQSHDPVFYSVCENGASNGSAKIADTSDSSVAPDEGIVRGYSNEEQERSCEGDGGSNPGSLPSGDRTFNSDSPTSGCQSFSLVEVRDNSLQTSMMEGNDACNERDSIRSSEDASYVCVQDMSLQTCGENVGKSNSSTHTKENEWDENGESRSVKSRKSSSGSSYLEVEDASLQTSHQVVNCDTVPEIINESDSDSFDNNLYKSIALEENVTKYFNAHGDMTASRSTSEIKSPAAELENNFFSEEEMNEDDKSSGAENSCSGLSSDDEFIPLKDRIKVKDGKYREGREMERKKKHTHECDAKKMQDTKSKEPYMEKSLEDTLPDLSDTEKPNIDTQTSTQWRSKQLIDSDSSDEDLESFFQKMKTPAKQTAPAQSGKEKSRDDSLDDFIVEDDMGTSDDELFYITTDSHLPSPKPVKRPSNPVICLSSDEDEDVFKATKAKPDKKKTPKPKIPKKALPVPDFERGAIDDKYSFLKSLSSNLSEAQCDREALRFVKNFKKTKEELTKRLFSLYNESIFDRQLPEDLNIIWNNRLLRTAGYCVYKKNAVIKNSNSVRVELSTKVCDSAERVRDTLIHELCHAAVWLLHGRNDGHGPYWRLWAQKANLTHPELPVIARCHSYSIATKYTYQCSKCGYSIGRHSKSLDTKRKVCGYCHGEFVLLSNNKTGSRTSDNVTSTPATPRTPNKFAMFVKENYGKVKEREKSLKHGDIMKLLSKDFAGKNKIS